MGSAMREDAKALIKADGLTYMGAKRRVVATAVAAVPAEDAIQMIACGELEHYHVLVPLPEKATGTVVICDSGVVVGWREGFTGSDCRYMPWEKIVRVNLAVALGGMKLEVADAEARFILVEQVIGKTTQAHAFAASNAFAAHIEGGEQFKQVVAPEEDDEVYIPGRRAHSKKNRKKKK